MIIPNDLHVCKHQLEVMNLDPLASYVKQREGQRVIRKILISNNGMAAVKARSSDRLHSSTVLCFDVFDLMSIRSLDI